MSTNTPIAAGGPISESAFPFEHSFTLSGDRVVTLGEPLDGDKSIEMTAINIAKEAADLLRFFLALFEPVFLARPCGLAPGGSSLLHLDSDRFPLDSSVLGSPDVEDRRDELRPGRVVDAGSSLLLADRPPHSGSFRRPDLPRDEETFTESPVESFFLSELGMAPLRAVAAAAESDLAR